MSAGRPVAIAYPLQNDASPTGNPSTGPVYVAGMSPAPSIACRLAPSG